MVSTTDGAAFTAVYVVHALTHVEPVTENTIRNVEKKYNTWLEIQTSLLTVRTEEQRHENSYMMPESSLVIHEPCSLDNRSRSNTAFPFATVHGLMTGAHARLVDHVLCLNDVVC